MIEDAFVNHEALIFRRGRIYPESFPLELYAAPYKRTVTYGRFLVKNYWLRRGAIRLRSGLWVIDTLSPGNYFHWLIEIKMSSSRAPSGALENGFEEFWLAYPRKAKKAQARAAYAKVLADGLATADELVVGAVAYTGAREGQDETYTQHPANWLKNEGWHDEHNQAQPARKRSNVEVALDGYMGGNND